MYAVKPFFCSHDSIDNTHAANNLKKNEEKLVVLLVATKQVVVLNDHA